jgi:DNA ligase (NAD+)
MSGFDFTALPDFGEVLHNNITAWFREPENLKLWKELRAMVTIEDKATNTAVRAAPFYGRNIVVTGTLEHFTRSGINAKSEELGAKAGSAVSKNTDYLICGDKAGSKLDKARSLGITVLSERQFLDMAESA